MLNKRIISTYTAIRQCCKNKVKIKQKMQTASYFRQVSSIAKQAGLMSTNWLAITCLGNDRSTPEHYSRVREGWDL